MARSGLCISGWSPAAYLANVCGSASGAGDSVHTPRHGDCKPAADFELRKAALLGWAHPRRNCARPDPAVLQIWCKGGWNGGPEIQSI